MEDSAFAFHNGPETSSSTSEEGPFDDHLLDNGLYLFGWGSNGFGQLGIGDDFMEVEQPERLDFSRTFALAEAGAMHSVVARMSGSVWSTGVNDDGALGRPTASGEDEMMLGQEETYFQPVQLPRGTSPVVQLACTDSGSFALLEDGSILGWGTFRDDNGVYGFSSEIDIQRVPVKVYAPHSYGSRAVKISSGANHVVAILNDGSAISWGYGDLGQLGRISLRHSRRDRVRKQTMLTPSVIPGFRGIRFVSVSCGENSTFLRTNDGRYYACGLNDCGQLAMPHDYLPPNERPPQKNLTVEDLVGTRHIVLTPTPVDYLDVLNVSRLAVGETHGIAVVNQRSIYTWGHPAFGKLGRGHMDHEAPTAQPALAFTCEGANRRIRDVAAGSMNSSFIDTRGALYTWGAHDHAMVGDFANEDVFYPRRIPQTPETQNRRFRKVSMGGHHCLALAR